MTETQSRTDLVNAALEANAAIGALLNRWTPQDFAFKRGKTAQSMLRAAALADQALNTGVNDALLVLKAMLQHEEVRRAVECCDASLLAEARDAMTKGGQSYAAKR